MIYVSSHAMHIFTKECVFVSVDDERQMFFDCVWMSCCCCCYSIALSRPFVISDQMSNVSLFSV